jgi:magnesium-transporting ATPase (P-type)
MVTGDHQATATAVARELRIAAGEDGVMPGDRLSSLTAEQLEGEVDRYHGYARVDPSDKVKIVRAWQGRGEALQAGDGSSTCRCCSPFPGCETCFDSAR